MKNWEVTIIEMKSSKRMWYKVTRRIPEFHTFETKVFSSKEKAMRQFQEWLG